jgi:hypothetical protein
VEQLGAVGSPGEELADEVPLVVLAQHDLDAADRVLVVIPGQTEHELVARREPRSDVSVRRLAHHVGVERQRADVAAAA